MKIRHILLLAAGALLYFFVNFQRTAVPGAIFNELQSELACDAGYVTAMGSSFMCIYAVCQLLTGLCIARLGGFRSMLLGGFFLALGGIGFPICHSIWTMYLFRAFTGFGAGFIYLSMIQELRRIYPGQFTILFGFFVCLGYAGSITAGTPFVALVHSFSWRPVLMTLGLLSGALYLFFALTLSTVSSPAGEHHRWDFRPLLGVYRNPLNRRLACFTCLNWGLYYTLLTVIGKKFLEDYCGLGAIAAVWVITAMGMLSAFSNCTSGILSHAMGNRRRPFLLSAAGLASVSYGLMSLALILRFHSSILCALFLLVTLTASQSPVQVAAMHELNAPENGAATVAVLNFTSYLMVALFRNLCGWLMELFPSDLSGGLRIYSSNSYLVFFLFATFVSCLGFFRVRLLPETGK